MKRIVCLLILCASASRLLAQVPANVTSRVLQIRFNGFTGSAFIVDYKEKSYLVTAKHMVETAGGDATVDVLGPTDSVWHPSKFVVLHGPSPCVDVAVLVPPDANRVSIDPLPYDYLFFMGQEAYFLGYPLGLFTTFSGQTVAVPLIKHGYISAKVSCAAIYPNGSQDDSLILLDGINNHGFSGGPVVAPDIASGTRAFKLVGVISGYKYEDEPINVDGKKTSNVTGSANSGIILVVPIARAIELIKDYVAKENAATPK